MNLTFEQNWNNLIGRSVYRAFKGIPIFGEAVQKHFPISPNFQKWVSANKDAIKIKMADPELGKVQDADTEQGIASMHLNASNHYIRENNFFPVKSNPDNNDTVKALKSSKVDKRTALAVLQDAGLAQMKKGAEATLNNFMEDYDKGEDVADYYLDLCTRSGKVKASLNQHDPELAQLLDNDCLFDSLKVIIAIANWVGV